MSSGQRRVTGGRNSCFGVVGAALALLACTAPAQAKHHRSAGHVRVTHHVRPGHPRAHHVSARRFTGESPMFAAMAVDAGTGRTLYAAHEDDLRHPASITKVMTLYLLFEKLKSGEMHLDDRIPVSAHAASMAPTKLGLRPGSTIRVEDAVKAIVTKSANDMAVAVAESIGGDERSFAGLMTNKARALGMARTQYVNASGLPDARQLTTARDLTVLGRAIHANFPSYYHFFSIPSFSYAGQVMPNHNHLLGRVEGMDGIKTGYTAASGFNLLTSVARGGHRIVSVVLGGRTAASRDRIMAALIEDHIGDTSTTRLAETSTPTPLEQPSQTVADAEDGASDKPHESAASQEAPAPREAEIEETGPSLIAPTLALPPVRAPRPVDHARTVARSDRAPSAVERPRPAVIPSTPKIDRTSPALLERRRLALDGSNITRSTGVDTTETAMATATPASLRWKAGPSGIRLPAALPPRPAALDRAEGERTRVARTDPEDRTDTVGDRGGWTIQIGATDAADKATDLLNRAKTRGSSALASAHPFTEKVRKGDATLYRARFAGLEPQQAEAACRTLKRSGFACFATRD